MTKGITVNEQNIGSILKAVKDKLNKHDRKPEFVIFVKKRTDRYRGKGRPRKTDYQTTNEIIEDKFGIKEIKSILGG